MKVYDPNVLAELDGEQRTDGAVAMTLTADEIECADGMSEQPQAPRFHCPKCRRSFTTRDGLARHGSAMHPGKPFSRFLRKTRRRHDDESIGEMMFRATWDEDPALDWVRDMQ